MTISDEVDVQGIKKERARTGVSRMLVRVRNGLVPKWKDIASLEEDEELFLQGSDEVTLFVRVRLLSAEGSVCLLMMRRLTE